MVPGLTADERVFRPAGNPHSSQFPVSGRAWCCSTPLLAAGGGGYRVGGCGVKQPVFALLAHLPPATPLPVYPQGRDGLYSSGAELEHKERLFLVPQSGCPAGAVVGTNHEAER